MAEGYSELSEKDKSDPSLLTFTTESEVVADTNKLHKTLQSVLKKQFNSLNNALKNCLKDVANEMYAEGLISNEVKDKPTYDSIIQEFKAGMIYKKDISQLEGYCQTFLDCLYNGSQGGPARGAAQNLAEEWKKDVHDIHSISLSIYCGKETKKQKIEMPKCDLQKTLSIQFRTQQEEKQVQYSLKDLSKRFATLMTAVQTALDIKLNQSNQLARFARWVEKRISWAKLHLSDELSVDEIFRKIHPYYDFIDCELIVEISEQFLKHEKFQDGDEIKDLIHELNEHLHAATSLRDSTTVKQLKDDLKELYDPHRQNLENMPKICIELQNRWYDATIQGLYLLIRHLLPYRLKQSLLQNIDIETGSILITYVIHESQVDCLIAHAQGRLQFMRLIGIFGLKINGKHIFKDDENKNFTFDVALLEAAKVGHTEAVQFLLELGASVNTALLKALQDDQIEVVSLLMELGGNIDDALLEAAKHGHTEAVQFLLELGASMDIALLKAVRFGQNETVSILMELGGNIDDVLLEVAKVGHCEAVSLFLKFGARINYRNENGLTPLMLATLGGHEQVVQTLVSAGANVNIQNNEGCTALMIASEKGHTWFFKLLLKENADVNIQANNGMTALMLASLNGHIEVAELLLKENADINTQGQNGVSALMLASQNGHIKVVELLLKQNTDVNIQDINGWTAIMIACINGHAEVAELLLKADADVNIQETNGMTALMLASQNGYTTIAELLLKKKVDVNIQEKKGWTALMKASRNGHAEVAQLLFKGDVDVNIQGKNGVTALMLASQYGHTKMAEELVKQNADVNIQAKNGFFALMLASLNGHTQIAELLLKENADINIQTKNGWTALMIASQNGHTQVAELLLKADADVNIQDEDGLTALILASQKGETEVVELLLNANTDVNIEAKNGVTALMLASQNGHTQVVELLVEELVDVDFCEKSGNTALMLASINGHLQVAECLLQSHADPHIIAYNGATAFSLAAYSGNKDLVNMLLDKSEPTINEIEKAVVTSCYSGHPTLITFLLNKLPHLTNNHRELLDSCVKGDLGAVIIKILDSPDIPLVLGLTPLMVASSCGHVDIVDALIQAGANVNKQENHLGLTPLFFAVKGGQSSLVVETLLMYGASPNVIATTNETPLDVAIRVSEKFQMDAISKLLIKYGGQTTLQLQGGEPKTLFLTFDELKTTPTSLQTTQKMQTIKLFEDKEQDKARISSYSSYIDLLT